MAEAPQGVVATLVRSHPRIRRGGRAGGSVGRPWRRERSGSLVCEAFSGAADRLRARGPVALVASGAAVDDVETRCGRPPEADPKEAVEGSRPVAPPVPSEDELVEAALEVLPVQAVAAAQCLALELREHPVGPLQGPRAPCGRQSRSAPAGSPARCRSCHSPQPDAAEPSAFRELHRGGQKDPALCAAALPGQAFRPSCLRIARIRAVGFRSAAVAAGHGRLVHLHDPLQEAPARVHHRPAQSVQQQLRGLAAADARPGLRLQRRDAVGVRGHEEPHLQRQAAAVHRRSGRHRGLSAAVRALAAAAFALHLPAPPPAAGGTLEAAAPAQLLQMVGAGIVVRQEFPGLLAQERPVVFPSAGHGRNTRRTNRAVTPPPSAQNMGLPVPKG